MTVKELREALADCSDEMEVEVDCSECGWCNVESVEVWLDCVAIILAP